MKGGFAFIESIHKGYTHLNSPVIRYLVGAAMLRYISLFFLMVFATVLSPEIALSQANGFCSEGDVIDCSGVCGGSKRVDDCGVCDGRDRDKDDCGICNGGNADKGCDGRCFSGLVNDVCGVCGGSGPTGCDNKCGSTKVDIGCGCGVAKVNGCCPDVVNEGCGCGVSKVNGCCPTEINEGCGCGVARVNGCCPGVANEGCGCGVTKVNGCCPTEVNEGCGCGVSKVNGCCPSERNEGCGCGVAKVNGCCPGQQDLGCGCGAPGPKSCSNGTSTCGNCPPPQPTPEPTPSLPDICSPLQGCNDPSCNGVSYKCKDGSRFCYSNEPMWFYEVQTQIWKLVACLDATVVGRGGGGGSSTTTTTTGDTSGCPYFKVTWENNGNDLDHGLPRLSNSSSRKPACVGAMLSRSRQDVWKEEVGIWGSNGRPPSYNIHTHSSHTNCYDDQCSQVSCSGKTFGDGCEFQQGLP